MKKEIIRVRNITFAYPDNPPVLNNVSLRINCGDFAILTGPNGAAKTTLVKIILGLLIPQAGSVELLPSSTGKTPVIGYVPQRTPGFNPGFPLTVEEAVGLHCGRHKTALKQVLERVDLPKKGNCLLGSLSGGQLQRVQLACALAKDPQVLIFDEAMANLDVQSQSCLLSLLGRLHQEGRTIIMVTHQLAPLKEYSSRLLELNNGTIREIGGASIGNTAV